MISSNFFGLVLLAVVATPCLGQVVDCSSGTQGDCNGFVSDFCVTATTVMAAGDGLSRCFNTGTGAKRASCDLSVINGDSDEALSTAQDCSTVLKKIATECPSGGSGLIHDGGPLNYAIRPNIGRCPKPAARENSTSEVIS
ncbi:hypothetical protein C8R44DRAFT_893698 [Mycena epipterygia]|nr:hypothetical protein C8R44DRAFT_893698 [Mycena epipterygia]